MTTTTKKRLPPTSYTDHSLTLAAVGLGRNVARWEAWKNHKKCVLIVRGVRHYSTLDPTGCPVLTDPMREALMDVLSRETGGAA